MNGQTVFVQQQLLERQTDRDFQFQLSYPFSQVQRIDLSTGYTNISFDNQLKTAAFDPVTGDQVLYSTQDLPSSRSLASKRRASPSSTTTPFSERPLRFWVSVTDSR